MELWELAAREAIRETVARYAHLVDRGRIDELVELFVEDGVLEAGDRPPARGRAAIRELFLETGKRLASASARPLIRHHVSNLLACRQLPELHASRSLTLCRPQPLAARCAPIRGAAPPGRLHAMGTGRASFRPATLTALRRTRSL